MRLVFLFALLISLTACVGTRHKPEQIDTTKQQISSEQSQRIDQAAGAVAATGELLGRTPPAIDAARETNMAAASALPKPSVEAQQQWQRIAEELVKGERASLNKALDALAASEARQRDLESKLEAQRMELNAALAKQAALDRKRAEDAESRKSIVEKQTIGLTAAGVVMILLAAFALYRTHTMLAATLGGIGVGLIALGRIVATLPDWVWSLLFGLGVIGIPAALYVGYRRGLFQKPPSQVGEYTVNHT